jgi:hypothetical protein
MVLGYSLRTVGCVRGTDAVTPQVRIRRRNRRILELSHDWAHAIPIIRQAYRRVEDAELVRLQHALEGVEEEGGVIGSEEVEVEGVDSVHVLALAARVEGGEVELRQVVCRTRCGA